VEALGFWPHEEAAYLAILRKPYGSLEGSDCIWIAGEAEVFLPPSHIRYFAPALVEHCQALIDNEHYLEQVIAAMVKAMPLPDAAALAARVSCLTTQFSPRRFTLPVPGGDWRTGGPELLRGCLLRLAIELDRSSVELATAPATGPTAMALVELAFGVFEESWDLPGYATTANALLATLERIAQGSDRHAALGAAFVLGEVPVERLPTCSDPGCPVHPDR
jgi:hypothetical protein